jgi:hypothetical protein
MNQKWIFSIVLGLVLGLTVLALIGCGSTNPTSLKPTFDTNKTPGNPDMIEVVSVMGPLTPINPGGPNVEITLKNISSQPVTALSANLQFNQVFSFTFDVSSSNPLLPGKTVSTRRNLIGAGFSDNVTYSMVVNGVLQDGEIFSLNKQVQIQPGASPPVSTLMPTPKPAEPLVSTAGPEVFIPESDTVAMGTVIEGLPPAQQGKSVFRDWIFNVDEYVIKPLSDTSLKIRILEQESGLSVKGVHLREGEHLLVFLKKADDHFVFAGGLIGAKFTIQDNSIRNATLGDSHWESLDEAISRIKAAAETWSGEVLTPDRRAQIQGIALDDASVKEFLLGKESEVINVTPYLVESMPGEIRYAVEIQSPSQQRWETDLVVIVNATRKRVDNLILNVNSTEFTEADKNETQRIALADKTVQEIIGNRGYEISSTSRDYWQEMQGEITLFHIFPVVELFLYPRGSENLYVFVDLDQQSVVKIFTESRLSQKPLESIGVDRDFTLTISIPKTEYRVGEDAEAVMTLKYTGNSPVELSSPGGEYFNLFIKDKQNNFIYNWRDEKYQSSGQSASSLPAVNETIEPGWSATSRLQFRVLKSGTLYLKGLTFNDGYGYQVTVSRPQSSGGFGVNADTPFLVIQAR